MIPELQLLGIAGLLIHALKDFADHNNQGKAYKLNRSIPTYLLSLITTSVLIYLKDDIASLYVVTPFSALALGYLGNSVFFSFIKAKTKDDKPVEKPAEKTEGEDGSKPPEEERPDKP